MIRGIIMLLVLVFAGCQPRDPPPHAVVTAAIASSPRPEAASSPPPSGEPQRLAATHVPGTECSIQLPPSFDEITAAERLRIYAAGQDVREHTRVKVEPWHPVTLEEARGWILLTFDSAESPRGESLIAEAKSVAPQHHVIAIDEPIQPAFFVFHGPCLAHCYGPPEQAELSRNICESLTPR